MTFLKTEVDRQIAAHREARNLFDVHGRSARELAKKRARDFHETPWLADYWWCVAGALARASEARGSEDAATS